MSSGRIRRKKLLVDSDFTAQVVDARNSGVQKQSTLSNIETKPSNDSTTNPPSTKLLNQKPNTLVNFDRIVCGHSDDNFTPYIDTNDPNAINTTELISIVQKYLSLSAPLRNEQRVDTSESTSEQLLTQKMQYMEQLQYHQEVVQTNHINNADNTGIYNVNKLSQIDVGSSLLQRLGISTQKTLQTSKPLINNKQSDTANFFQNRANQQQQQLQQQQRHQGANTTITNKNDSTDDEEDEDEEETLVFIPQSERLLLSDTLITKKKKTYNKGIDEDDSDNDEDDSDDEHTIMAEGRAEMLMKSGVGEVKLTEDGMIDDTDYPEQLGYEIALWQQREVQRLLSDLMKRMNVTTQKTHNTVQIADDVNYYTNRQFRRHLVPRNKKRPQHDFTSEATLAADKDDII